MTVRILDLRRAVFGDGVIQSVYAKVGEHRVAQPPTQNLARGTIHDCDQIQEPVLDRHEGNVGAPNLVRAVDLRLPQQIRKDQYWGCGWLVRGRL